MTKYPLPVPQSPAIDTNAMPDDTWVRCKTIVITGGASGFGEGFFRRWAANGANVVIGDINVQKGDQLVREVRSSTGNPNLHYFHCDVTNWQSQVQFFKDAINVSPHGGIDTGMLFLTSYLLPRNVTLGPKTSIHALDVSN